ncbi:hypothetical protein [Polymorphobacter sp. PAMC 29334]|uniref:hypothetical protein n=1 Tax=Polymorphobacter sp. PAMC 29334 TaxID=2862331 RepID=UPI001D005E66|nr:hypothetical protein [Polymorphobacter sp. PAMC 29334]
MNERLFLKSGHEPLSGRNWFLGDPNHLSQPRFHRSSRRVPCIQLAAGGVMTAFIKGFAMRFTTALLLCLAIPVVAMAQTPAPASAAAQVKAGAKVFDTSGGEVGTIDAVNGDVAVVTTGTNKVSIPTASFGAGAAGPVLAMTKVQLDAAASAAAAKSAEAAKAALKPGTEVHGSAGTVIGTVKALDGEFAMVTTPKGDVRLPTTLFGMAASGLTIGMSSAEFDKAVSAATAGGAPAQ